MTTFQNQRKNMKTALAPLLALALTTVAGAQNPRAADDAMVVSGNARFTVLTPEMIRIEYSDNAAFEDRATFAIQNRRMGKTPAFTTAEDSEYLYISTYRCRLKYRKGSNPAYSDTVFVGNLTITFLHNGDSVTWYPGKPDALNLKGTCRTLDGCNGDNKRAEMENGLISRSGWAVIDDSWSARRPDGSRSFALEPNAEVGYDWWAPRADTTAVDLYFLGYGNRYKKAIGDFTRIAGKVPLPPAYVFGYWYSRYYSYSADDYRQIMHDLKANDIPTDVLILDMDWHWNGRPASLSEGIGGWTGWSWNTRLIPEPKKLLGEIHSNNLKVALNLHPADGIDSTESPRYFRAMLSDLNGKYAKSGNIAWYLDYPDFTRSFFRNIIRDHEAEGVDFWWLDWQQHLTSPYTPGLGQTFWCNHVFFNDMARNRPDRRPVIFHRWGGLGSHRYQIGFSGDALINFPTLAFEPYFTATASNVAYAYWGHDLGGHAFTDPQTVNDPELMLRWIQFGVFTPIFRSHATDDSRIERRLWRFPNLPLLRDAVKLRYALFPYIYTAARQTYDTGIGMCRPLYYEYPDAEEAYAHEGQYFFGDDILVAPITEPAGPDSLAQKEIWFPAGNWWSAATSELISGSAVRTLSFTQSQTPYFLRQGAVIPLNPPTVRNVTASPDTLILQTVSGSAGTGSLYEDAGDNPDYATAYAITPFTHDIKGKTETITIGARRGNCPGLVASRTWQLDILNAERPKTVKVNGKTVNKSAWKFDAAAKTLTINIPDAKCADSTIVEVRR